MPDTSTTPEFDSFAGDYDTALAQGLSVSGEDKNYFARRRLRWLAQRLNALPGSPINVMDFGCGTGSATPFFFATWPHMQRLVGTDVSPKSLDVAIAAHASARTQFVLMRDYQPAGDLDLVFCNGVFHHIPPLDRLDAMQFIYASLRSGGLFALWENNPWNPGTRYVMNRIPFDRDAITLSPLTGRQLVRKAGFEILQTDFCFYFPRLLRPLRPLERLLVKLPLGAQYLVLGRKP